MIETMEGYFWETLYIIKQMHDHGLGEKALCAYGKLEIDSDYIYEISWSMADLVFADMREYYNEDGEYQTFVFFDPIFNEFYRLCEEYERKNGIAPEKNTFRKEIKREIDSGCSFNCYSYSHKMETNLKSRHGCRLILLIDPEFCCYHEVPGGLLEVREAFRYLTKRIKKELGMEPQGNIIALPAKNEEREAA